ncbi:hypothetical protein CAPTEDRAFT_190860, partial [Capitella teleta]
DDIIEKKSPVKVEVDEEMVDAKGKECSAYADVSIGTISPAKVEADETKEGIMWNEIFVMTEEDKDVGETCDFHEVQDVTGEKLQRYVVDDLAKSVQAMLGVVMTNTLALTITWTGNSHGATIYNRVKKNRFLDLESLIQTLLDALIATRFKKAALCDVRNATQNWLSNSPDRIDPTTGTGGKKERMERIRKRKEQMFSEDAIEHDSSNSVLE